MAILVNAHQISKAFGARPLFEGVTFSVETGERIGLIGPNGAGKSTLLKIIAGETTPDSGTYSAQRGLRVGYLAQVPQFEGDVSVEAAVMEGVTDPHDWEQVGVVHEVLSHLALTEISERRVSELSGGWKKRVALARELARRPDLLLLDEPTNHLDVESILWLEELLAGARFATLTITHDRLFLQRISNRILELDRRNPGGLLSIQGDYATYLETKQTLMEGQMAREDRLKNTLRRETEWLRRGAKARTTKQQARITRAGDLKDEVEELSFRNRTGTMRLDFQASEKTSRKLIDAVGISKSYGDRVVVPKLDLRITAGSRIALLGANGCGKSTLIRLLTGEERPDSGEIKRSDQLQVSLFEQNRESLDPSVSLMRTLCPTGDHVQFRGASVHIKGYLDRFMFRHEQMEMAVGKLSGGEQSRLLIAKLMLQPANLLILDEPTNDLDVATLDVLQGVLQEFDGAVILVTHDRYFLDQVADQILAFGGEGPSKKIVPFSSLTQWESWHAEQGARSEEAARATLRQQEPVVAAPKKRSWDSRSSASSTAMESTIHTAEAKLAALASESADPAVTSKATRLAEIAREMATTQAEIDRLYARWAELES